MMSSTLIIHQSTVPVRFLIGVNTRPRVKLSAVSGFNSVFPPCRKLYWPAGLNSAVLPKRAGASPVRAHCAGVADGPPAPPGVGSVPQGSVPMPNRLFPRGWNSSMTFA